MGTGRRRPWQIATAGLVSLGFVSPVAAQDATWSRPPINLFGSPGMLDMPTAHPMRDADATVTVSAFEKTQRNTFHFQLTPRLSGSFRYSYIDNLIGIGDFYDRSFDLRYLIAEETATRPAITVGLQDFGGTGIYAGEYVVATKTFGRLRATGGIGWGRFGSRNGFENPLGVLADGLRTRPGQGTGGQTGQLDADHWFRGDAAFFGGLQYRATDRLTLTAEYSSDAYTRETTAIGFDAGTPLNFGASYAFRNGVDLSAAYLYGSTLAVQFSYTYNPKATSAVTGGLESAPPTVMARAPGASRDLGWTLQPDGPEILRDNVTKVFAGQGLVLEAFDVGGTSVTLRMRNTRYLNPAQAVGRAGRLLSQLMPASVETFTIVLVSDAGLPASRVVLKRSDLEDLEFAHDAAWLSYARADIGEVTPGDLTLPVNGAVIPSFSWGIGSFVDFSFFDPASPVRADAGIEAHARYEPMPGLVFSGQVKQRLIGNRDGIRASNSILPRVRSDTALYAQSDFTMPYLFGSYYFRPGENLYGRVSAGYLEEMYGGLSTEVLWKPVGSRFAVGAELNYVKQRDFDQDFAFRDYEIATGHVSGYWSLGNGYQAQVDAGRYLAGDWGSTLTLDREFGNGVRIGAFATFTDVSFADFGEGSFDKGIRFSVPVSLITGRPTKQRITRVIRPTTRDGGARLFVQDRLYGQVRDYHQTRLADGWGRFWR